MRTDNSLDDSIRDCGAWEENGGQRTVALIHAGEAVTPSRIDGLKSSFSGHERNHLFLNKKAKAFDDVSALSGLDSDKDGRVFVKWDFDRDGWIDLAVINNNRPLVNLYRNELGSQEAQGQVVALRFVGGNTTPQPNRQFSCRDGIGAKVSLTAGDLRLVREHRCGEGMAAQNSSTMLIGIGDRKTVDAISIRWPSGKTQQVSSVEAGSLLTFYENPAEVNNDSGVVITTYCTDTRHRNWSESAPNETDVVELLNRLHPLKARPAAPKEQIHVFTSTATWCPSCKEGIPQWNHLTQSLGNDAIAIHAVPIDRDDTPEMIEKYVEKYRPAYKVLSNAAMADRDKFQETLVELIGRDVLPSTVVTDGSYNILLVTPSVPTLSQINQAMDDAELSK